MAELSVDQKAVLAQMIERLPDRTLKTLALAVRQMPGGKARALATMLSEETADRRRRGIAFAPLVPLFRPRPDGVDATTFPAAVLPRLWKAASAKEPALLAVFDDPTKRPGDAQVIAVSNRICVAAAGVIRDQPGIIWPEGGDPAAREAGLAELALCFDLATLARRGLAALPGWIGRPTEDQLAELRLLVRDSGEVTPDGGPRILEILFAHLGDASLVLRLVVHSSRAAGKEGVLSESEMASFIDRLIGAVEARVARIAAFRPGQKACADTLKADIGWCAETLAELDRTLQLDPDGAWGTSAREARGRINRTLAGVLKASAKALDAVMPTRRVPTAGRMTREAPDFTDTVRPEAIEAATVLMTVVGAVRTAAQIFGCESQRSQLVQSAIDRITTHVDLIIEEVNAGDTPDEAAALARVETLARLLVVIEANDAARTVRRRAAAAGRLPSATTEPSPRAA